MGGGRGEKRNGEGGGPVGRECLAHAGAMEKERKKKARGERRGGFIDLGCRLQKRHGGSLSLHYLRSISD